MSLPPPNNRPKIYATDMSILSDRDLLDQYLTAQTTIANTPCLVPNRQSHWYVEGG